MQRGVSVRGEEERRGSTEHPLPQAPRSPLPVFIFPPGLDFYADDQTSHKQVLTLYNPFPRVLRFKVLSTAPLRYTVVDAEGLVKPNSCIDIVVRHRDISARHYGITDKFRIDVWEEGAGKSAGGRKDIIATLHPTKLSPRERGPQDPPMPWHQPTPMFSVRHGFPRPLSPGVFSLYILVGLVALTVLMLPLHGDPRSLLHENLHVSVIQKLVAAPSHHGFSTRVKRYGRTVTFPEFKYDADTLIPCIPFVWCLWKQVYIGWTCSDSQKTRLD